MSSNVNGSVTASRSTIRVPVLVSSLRKRIMHYASATDSISIGNPIQNKPPISTTSNDGMRQ